MSGETNPEATMSASDRIGAQGSSGMKNPQASEQQEMENLRKKYPNLQIKGAGASLLHKRLQKGQRYFDSGDYNMAKAKLNNPGFLQESIGSVIPKPIKPENLPRTQTHPQSKLAAETTS